MTKIYPLVDIPTIEVDTEARESCLKLNKMLLVVLKQLC